MNTLTWSNDHELFEKCRKGLFAAVIGDIMDQLGYKNQFLPPQVQPLRDNMVAVGRAMPVLEIDDAGGDGPGRHSETLNRPFGLMLTALDDLQKDEVYICSGASPDFALWGELMSKAATNKGATGAVLDGYSRDTRGILTQNFPCFSYGRYAKDQRPRGKVVDFRCTISFGGVTVRPGDIVFGDLDGVCIIPKEIEEETLRRAWEKAHGEKLVYEAICKGMGAQEAWDTFGIL